MKLEQALGRLGLMSVQTRKFVEFQIEKGGHPGMAAELAYNCMVAAIHRLAKDAGLTGEQITAAMDPGADMKWVLDMMRETALAVDAARLEIVLGQAKDQPEKET